MAQKAEEMSFVATAEKGKVSALLIRPAQRKTAAGVGQNITEMTDSNGETGQDG